MKTIILGGQIFPSIAALAYFITAAMASAYANTHNPWFLGLLWVLFLPIVTLHLISVLIAAIVLLVCWLEQNRGQKHRPHRFAESSTKVWAKPLYWLFLACDVMITGVLFRSGAPVLPYIALACCVLDLLTCAGIRVAYLVSHHSTPSPTT